MFCSDLNQHVLNIVSKQQTVCFLEGDTNRKINVKKALGGYPTNKAFVPKMFSLHFYLWEEVYMEKGKDESHPFTA